MSDGVAYAACDTSKGVLVHAFDTSATELPGWPVRLPGMTASVYDNLFTIGCGDERSSLRMTADRAVVVAVAETDAAKIYELRPNGERLPGWPRPFPGDPPDTDGVGGNGCRGLAVTAADDIVAWGYQGVQPAIELIAARTEFTVYSPDGQTRPGWPRGSIGAASRPVIASDGSISYVSASSKVWRHRADGQIVDGWPYQLAEHVPPYVTPDGRLVMLVSANHDSDRAISLDADGDVTHGWPVSLARRVESRCLFGDVPCVGDIGPVVAADGTTFVSLGSDWTYGRGQKADPGGAIIAIKPNGHVATGWPVLLAAHSHAVSLTADARGHLVVGVVTCDPVGCGNDRSTMVFAADGSLMKAGD